MEGIIYEQENCLGGQTIPDFLNAYSTFSVARDSIGICL